MTNLPLNNFEYHFNGVSHRILLQGEICYNNGATCGKFSISPHPLQSTTLKLAKEDIHNLIDKMIEKLQVAKVELEKL